MTTSTLTVQERFEAAVQEAKDNGCQVLENFKGDYDCACCANAEDYIEDVNAPFVWNTVWTAGYDWTYGGNADIYQVTVETEVYWDDEDEDAYEEEEYHATTSLHHTSTIGFNHGNGGGALFAAALRNYGFEVKWESEAYKVIVTLK